MARKNKFPNAKYLFVLIPFAFPACSFAQEAKDSTTLLSGIVLDEDSLPVENAYLIRFSTTSYVTTGNTGKFTISLQRSDSLMVYHLSYKRLVLRVEDFKNRKDTIILKKEIHIIPEVTINDHQRDLINLQKNMEGIRVTLKQPYNPQKLKREGSVSVSNPYSPQANDIDLAINLIEILKKLKKKKLQND